MPPTSEWTHPVLWGLACEQPAPWVTFPLHPPPGSPTWTVYLPVSNVPLLFACRYEVDDIDEEGKE